MPQKNLNNRLEKLEKEIHGLLKIQENQCTEIKNVMLHHQCSIQESPRIQHVRSSTRVNILRTKNKPKVYKARSKAKSAVERTRPSNNTNICDCVVPATSFVPCDTPVYVSKYLPPTEANVKQKLSEEREKVEQAYDIINDLKEELKSSKARMSSMTKEMALLTDALQSLRTKYKNIKTFRKDAITQIELLKKTNCELCCKLEQELKCHAEQVKHLRKTEGTKFEQKITHATKLLEQSEELYQKLVNVNENLKCDCEQLNTKYLDARNEIEDLKSLLNSQNQKNVTICQESEDLKSLLQGERSKNAMTSKIKDQLEKTIDGLTRSNNNAQMEMKELSEQRDELEQCKCELTNELKKKDAEYNKLECECETLKKQMNDYSSEDILKCKKFEKEIERLKKTLKDKETEINEEHRTLTSLIEELNALNKRHKTRINELVIINTSHEGLIKNQNIVICNKEHQVKMAEAEVETAKIQCQDLKQQIEKLRSSITVHEKLLAVEKQKEDECKNRVEYFQQELATIRQTLREEKEKLLIKEKIIEDQADTIKKLKNNMHGHGDELKQRNSIIIRLQKELNNEKYDKEQLQENIEEITRHKQELKYKISELERALVEKSNLPSKIDHQKRELIFLEHQITVKQKEHELHCKWLCKQKKKAVQAAEFATQELMDTVKDFKTYAESQKQGKTIITKMMHNKNNEVRKCICQKITKAKDTSMIKCSPAVNCVNTRPGPRRQISFR